LLYRKGKFMKQLHTWLGLIPASVLLNSALAFAATPPVALTDTKGMTLYIFDEDSTGSSSCYDSCAKAWPPLLTTESDFTAPISVTNRKDTTLQIAYQGKPLYTFQGDHNPGDKNGDGLGGVWHIARP